MLSLSKKTAVCDICHMAKQNKVYYEASFSITIKCPESLHMDLWGPYSTAVVFDNKYFLTVVDDYSRYIWIVLLKRQV